MLQSILYIGRSKKTQELILAILYIILASAFTYRLVFYPTAQLVPFLALALAAIFIIWRPIYGTALYFLVYPSVPQSGSINIIKFAMLLLTIFIFAIWIWQKLRIRDHVWNKPEYKWLFIFFLYISFSPLLGPANGFTVMDWARDIAPMLNLLLIPMLAEQLSVKQNRWLIYLLSITISIGLTRDFINLAGRYFPVPYNPLNIYSYGITTFHIGTILCAAIILFIYKVKPRTLWLALALLSLGCAALTITRTVWLSVVFTLSLMALFYTKFRKTSLILMAASIIGVTWFYFAPSEQSVSLQSHGRTGSWWSVQTERIYGARHKDIAVMNRNAEFIQARDKFLSSPLYGMGFGYIYYFWRYHVSGLGGSGFFRDNYTHNDLINILAKGGIIGFGLWITMMLLLLKKLYEKRKRGKGTVGELLPTIGIIAFINSFFVGSSTPVYQTREAMFFLSIIIALGLSEYELITNRVKEPLG